MRFMKIILLLFFALFMIVIFSAAIRTCNRASAPTQLPVSSNQDIIRQLQQRAQQPADPAPQQVQPQAPQQAASVGSAIKAMVISPSIIDEKAIALERGKGELNVYNVDCNSQDDALPENSIFRTTWEDFDTSNVNYWKKSPKTTFTTCTLGAFKLYFKAPEDGVYIIGLRMINKHSRASLRINGVQIFGMGLHWSGTEQVRLQKDGYYEFDFRFWKNDGDYTGAKGFAILLKYPSENEMHVITKDEIFMARAVEKK